MLGMERAFLSVLKLLPSQRYDSIPLFLSIVNQSPSLQRGNVVPVTAFTGPAPTLPISTFLSSVSAHSVTVLEVVL